MATKKTPIAARRKAQRDFHESVRLVMLLHEIEKSKDNEGRESKAQDQQEIHGL